MSKRQKSADLGLSTISGNVDQKENVDAKDLELEEKSNYYGQGEVLPLTEEEKIKRFVLIAFPVVFFIIAVVLAAVYN